jgi:hypothetical protein
MKKYIFKFSIWLIIAIAFTSCEKVIDIDLNSSAPKIVIEAEIYDQLFCKVKLSQTVNFDESNSFPAITGATIRISDNLGNSETLAETSAGNYIGSVLAGISGRTYTLEITADEKIYTAVSTMSPPINIDTLNVDTIIGHGVMQEKKYISVKYQDPPGVGNYYHFIQFINGIPQKDIYINEDRLQDGQTISTPLINQNSSNLETSDSITIQLLTIDWGVYNYFRTLLQTMGSGHEVALPANPLSNFNNGALGYFSAHAIKTKSIVIP